MCRSVILEVVASDGCVVRLPVQEHRAPGALERVPRKGAIATIPGDARITCYAPWSTDSTA